MTSIPFENFAMAKAMMVLTQLEPKLQDRIFQINKIMKLHQGIEKSMLNTSLYFILHKMRIYFCALAIYFCEYIIDVSDIFCELSSFCEMYMP